MRRLFFLLLFLPTLSFAQSGYYIYGGVTDSPKFSDPQSACDAHFDRFPLDGSTKAPYLKRPHESYYRCIVEPGDRQHGFVSFHSCPQDTVFNGSECVPPEEPDQCEAGNEVSHWKFFGKNTLYNIPPTACLVGCRYNHTSSTPCMGPVESNGAVGNSCKMTYTGTGEECSGGNDSPPDDEPPGPEAEENPDCKRFTNVDGSWGFDCSPKPDPDEENNSCPPGYMMQGDTCFRIPPEHPDYDPDKDPENPGNGDGGNGGNNGDGDENGDWAKESTLQGIDKTLKDIDKTGKAIESATKTGNATTHDLLRDIKDAIGNIPGGGGAGPGTGDGDGDGEDGDFDGTCEDETCGFGERDLFGDEVPSFSDSLTAIHTGIKNSPIGQSISSIQFPSGGTCPTGSMTISVMGHAMPLVFDSHCDLWESIRPIISAAFLALWALIAVRVFLSA